MLIDCEVNISNNNSHSYHGICRDLSVDGIGIDTPYNAAPEEKLTIHVKPPEGASVQPLSVTVEVLRSTALSSEKQPLYHVAARIIESK